MGWVDVVFRSPKNFRGPLFGGMCVFYFLCGVVWTVSWGWGYVGWVSPCLRPKSPSLWGPHYSWRHRKTPPPPPLPPPRVCASVGGFYVADSCRPNFSRYYFLWGVVCKVCGPNLSRGSPLGGEACRWGFLLGNSRRMGAIDGIYLFSVTTK